MSLYDQLSPIFASSIMHVVLVKNEIKYLNTITYDYVDNRGMKSDNFYEFLKISKNFDREVEIAWKNLQNFMDDEENLINNQISNQTVKHCNIFFRDMQHPFFQWSVEFSCTLIKGMNEYVNFVTPETLQYPIYALYHYHQPLKIDSIHSSMKYNLNPSHGIIEYYGDIGDELSGEESIRFQIE